MRRHSNPYPRHSDFKFARRPQNISWCAEIFLSTDLKQNFELWADSSRILLRDQSTTGLAEAVNRTASSSDPVDNDDLNIRKLTLGIIGGGKLLNIPVGDTELAGSNPATVGTQELGPSTQLRNYNKHGHLTPPFRLVGYSRPRLPPELLPTPLPVKESEFFLIYYPGSFPAPVDATATS
ncbi:hypothetical protein BDN72DRAFT_861704 [Pluteus cervinus]|uniref:Uncharacterized protein n=1 Tax=Pluteus cervinus TaxID=181527 RepID=A0ACD3ADL6_9AGAR|nr:hypothetical protein BDN72DRAFT_861704 [Pluteus cervinus]